MSTRSHPAGPAASPATSLRTEPAEFRARPVHVDLNGDRAVLRGTVSSYYQKQLAQEMARRIDGVVVVENHLEVEYPGESLATSV